MTQLSRQVIAEFRDIVGNDCLAQDEAALTAYAKDASRRSGQSQAVLFPQSAPQLAKIMQLATRERIPVTPRGAGSGMTGAAVPASGGIVVSFEKMNRIIELDTKNRFAVVEPGTITAELNRQAKKHGLCYPLDPSSVEFCTIGGNVATGAGGLRCVKYGATKNYLLGMQICLPSGQLLNVGSKTYKHSVGFDLTPLLVGSEGTLALFTEITVKLIPAPKYFQTLAAGFADENAAFETVQNLLSLPGYLSCCEYLDRHTIDCVKDKLQNIFKPLPKSLLLLEIDAFTADEMEEKLNAVTAVLYKIAGEQTRVANDDKQAQVIWDIRRAISPALAKLKPNKLNEDITVPPAKMPQILEFARKVCAKNSLLNANYGHAGDGNLHVNILYNGNNTQEQDQAFAAAAKIMQEVVKLGGTISGEHGIGLAKKPFLALEASIPLIDIWKSLKRVFDPQGILNRGKIFE